MNGHRSCSHSYLYSHLPLFSSQVLPKGKPWRDVVRYEDTEGNEV